VAGLVQRHLRCLGGGAMQDAHRERLAPQQRVGQRGLAGGDAAEYGHVQFAALQPGQHRLDAREVGGQLVPHRGRDGGVVEQAAQAVGHARVGVRHRCACGRRHGGRARPDPAAQASPQRLDIHVRTAISR
jgi:hypothetical protein